jgi:hypothetical protein
LKEKGKSKPAKKEIETTKREIDSKQQKRTNEYKLKIKTPISKKLSISTKLYKKPDFNDKTHTNRPPEAILRRQNITLVSSNNLTFEGADRAMLAHLEVMNVER